MLMILEKPHIQGIFEDFREGSNPSFSALIIVRFCFEIWRFSFLFPCLGVEIVLPAFSSAWVFPYFFPLQLKVEDICNVIVHPVCAGLLHLLRYMAVHVQGKGGCRVAKVAGNGFDIIPRTDRCHCVAMPLRYNNDKPEKSSIFKGFQGFKADF